MDYYSGSLVEHSGRDRTSQWVSQTSRYAPRYGDPLYNTPSLSSNSSSSSHNSCSSRSRSVSYASHDENMRPPSSNHSRASSKHSYSNHVAPTRHSPYRLPNASASSSFHGGSGHSHHSHPYQLNSSHVTSSVIQSSNPGLVPYTTSRGTNFLLPPGQGYVIVDGRKVEVVKVEGSNPSSSRSSSPNRYSPSPTVYDHYAQSSRHRLTPSPTLFDHSVHPSHCKASSPTGYDFHHSEAKPKPFMKKLFGGMSSRNKRT